MAWWLFGRKDEEENSSSEVEQILNKVLTFLDDEVAQNATFPESLRNVIKSNGSCDYIPSGFGEFGRTVTNPIPVNGPLGELLYLSSLITDDGHPVVFHRIGSLNNIDMFEVLATSGRHWDVIFLSLYYPRKSRALPSGYRFNPNQRQSRLFRGTNDFVEGFPSGIYQAALERSKQIIGIPIVDSALKDLAHLRLEKRGQSHLEKLGKLSSSTLTATPNDGNRNDLLGIFWKSYFDIKKLVEQAVDNSGDEVGEEYDREFVYVMLYVFTALLFRNGTGRNPASICDQLSEAVLTEYAEAAGDTMGAVVKQYSARFARYQEIDLLFAADEFLMREGSLTLGQNLIGKPAMILGTIAASNLMRALKPLNDSIAKLRF